MRRIAVISLLVVSLVLAPGVVVGAPDGESVAATGGDVTFEVEEDGDGDTGSTADSDSDSDSDTGSTADSDTDSTSDSDTDSTSDSGSTSDSDTDSTSDTDSNTDSSGSTADSNSDADTSESDSADADTTESDESASERDTENRTATEVPDETETADATEPATPTEASSVGFATTSSGVPTGVTADGDRRAAGGAAPTESDTGQNTTPPAPPTETTTPENASAAGGGAGDADSGASPGSSTGFGPSSAGAGVAVGVGVVAAGVIARRVLLTGPGGSANTVTSALTTARTAPRGTLRTAVSLASEFAQRVHTTLSDWVGRVLGAAGYTKWAGDEPLEHDTRAELYDHLQADPGTYLSAFAEASALDASLGTIRYHLRILEREGLVTSAKVGGKRRYYPIGTSPDALDIALESASTRTILEELTASPDTVSGLADRIDRDPSTVSHHLSRLNDDGLVERERDGQVVINRLTPGVETVLTQGPFAEAGAATADQPTTGD
jgi:DNA-binding transcriptional ArsR family regulator